jgi:CCR4-NOT transcription complex subunit 1
MWLLRFLSPFLKAGEMDVGARSTYKATLKILVVVLHDFPDFLVEYYHTLSTAVPPHCVQLRNIILSAFPPAQSPLPDWYRRLDQLVPEMQHVPVVRQDYIHVLTSGNVKAAIDQYVRSGLPQLHAIVAELKNRIAVKTMGVDGPVVAWNHTLLNATVFYLGTSAVGQSVSRTGSVEFDAEAPEVALLSNLAYALDAEGQYYLLSVIADQLRYPSAHTLWFQSYMLYLFSATSATGAHASTPSNNPAPGLPERIARVLVERVIVRKPHPWGLVVCFVELLNNEKYEFWKQPFVNAEEAIYVIFVKAHAGFMGPPQGQGQLQGLPQGHDQVQGQPVQIIGAGPVGQAGVSA